MSDNESEDMIDIDAADKHTLPLYKSAPERIGLAIGDETEDWLYEFDDTQEVAWFHGVEPVAVCVEYVRADLYNAAIKVIADLSESRRLLDEARIALLEQIVEVADGIMSVCGGDAWERECTEQQRDLYAQLYERAFPQPPATHTLSDYEFNLAQKTLRCHLCDRPHKKYSESGLRDHMAAKHPDAAILSAADTEVKK